FNIAKRGSDVSLVVSNFAAGGPPLTAHLSAGGFLETTALGLRNFVATNAPQTGSFLQLAVTKTNGSIVTVSVTNTPGNTDGGVLVKMLMDAINTNTALMAADGVLAEDHISYDIYLGRPGGEFNLLARAPGWPESQIQARLTGSGTFGIGPSGTVKLDDNVNDLQPRGHLYVTAGLTNL